MCYTRFDKIDDIKSRLTCNVGVSGPDFTYICISEL